MTRFLMQTLATSVSVLSDLNATFDTDDRVILQILEGQVGIFKTALEWLKYYFKDRICLLGLKIVTVSEQSLDLF